MWFRITKPQNLMEAQALRERLLKRQKESVLNLWFGYGGIALGALFLIFTLAMGNASLVLLAFVFIGLGALNLFAYRSGKKKIADALVDLDQTMAQMAEPVSSSQSAPSAGGVDVLDASITSATGKTRAAMELVRENLTMDDTCRWVGPATVMDMTDVGTGCVAVTDTQIWVSYGTPDSDHIFAYHASLSVIAPPQRLRGTGSGALFRIEGIPVQSIEMQPGVFSGLEAVLASSIQARADQPAPEQAQTGGVVESMQELQKLLDSGLIGQAEFDEKKAQILGRL